MTLTKADLADSLLNQGMTKKDARQLVESLFEEVRSQLEQGVCVKVSGFGNFELRDKAQRPGRNPKTGQAAPITARRVVTFKPGQKLRSIVSSIEQPEEEMSPEEEEAL